MSRSTPHHPKTVGSKTARMRPGRKQLVNWVGFSVWLTGVAWLVFHYFLRTNGAFGPEPNPLEPWWLKLHGLAAFAALWTFGLLWGVHVVQGWGVRRRRWTGAALFGVCGLLIGSGYLLYYAGSDEVRAIVSVVHWAIGLAALPAFLLHRLARVATAQEAPRPAEDASGKAAARS